MFKKKNSEVKITINTKKLIDNLGGVKNIEGAEYRRNNLKIFIINRNIVNVESIQKIKGITGLFAAKRYITIIVGQQAKQLAELLATYK